MEVGKSTSNNFQTKATLAHLKRTVEVGQETLFLKVGLVDAGIIDSYLLTIYCTVQYLHNLYIHIMLPFFRDVLMLPARDEALGSNRISHFVFEYS